MTPLDVVQPLEGEHKGSAGVVQKVERDAEGNETTIYVRLDTDRSKLVPFPPSALRVLRPHG